VSCRLAAGEVRSRHVTEGGWRLERCRWSAPSRRRAAPPRGGRRCACRSEPELVRAERRGGRLLVSSSRRSLDPRACSSSISTVSIAPSGSCETTAFVSDRDSAAQQRDESGATALPHRGRRLATPRADRPGGRPFPESGAPSLPTRFRARAGIRPIPTGLRLGREPAGEFQGAHEAGVLVGRDQTHTWPSQARARS
jgi:hypothetical protein